MPSRPERSKLHRASRHAKVHVVHAALSPRENLRAHGRADGAQHDERPLLSSRAKARSTACGSSAGDSQRLAQLDETSIKMTQQKKSSQVWALVGEKLTAYRFDLTRGSQVPLELLGKSRGVFVADDYSGYTPLGNQGHRTRCGCMAHTRRGFFEAGDVPEATTALALIQSLYAVEHEAQAQNIVGTKAHQALRLSRSKPIFTLLMKLSRHLEHAHGPKTILGKAARYAFSNLRELKRFLYDARIPLDNNWAKNALRIIAVGRKNFLFVQSKEAGEDLALLYSLTTSCARSNVNSIHYLTDVLDRIDDTKQSQLRDLLPDRWKPKLPTDAVPDEQL
jgi:transposase